MKRRNINIYVLLALFFLSIGILFFIEAKKSLLEQKKRKEAIKKLENAGIRFSGIVDSVVQGIHPEDHILRIEVSTSNVDTFSAFPLNIYINHLSAEVSFCGENIVKKGDSLYVDVINKKYFLYRNGKMYLDYSNFFGALFGGEYPEKYDLKIDVTKRAISTIVTKVKQQLFSDSLFGHSGNTCTFVQSI